MAVQDEEDDDTENEDELIKLVSLFLSGTLPLKILNLHRTLLQLKKSSQITCLRLLLHQH